MSYSSWGHKESDRTERVPLSQSTPSRALFWSVENYGLAFVARREEVEAGLVS